MNLALHAKQGEAFLTRATEVLYGGAAGGGKSHLMRTVSISWCAAIPGLQVYLFRRIRDDLVKNHMEGPNGFHAMLAAWKLAGLCTIVEDEIRFWNGSKIYLCHCKDPKDVYKYQGSEIHVLLIDEATHFTEAMYRFLRNRVRMVGMYVPEEYAGCFPRILLGANPGNIGHAWVKSTFVDFAAPMELRQAANDDGGMLRQYIPARLSDNPSMARDDPGYEARLSGLGSETLVRAMRDGDWDVIEGAFYTELSRAAHALRPFSVPKNWLRFRSFDWGSAKPFSVGWWAVVGEDFDVQGKTLPRGALVRYREWYGAAGPNIGLKLTAGAVARGIKEREGEERIAYGVADPSIWKVDGGPSIAERMLAEGITFKPADNKRVAGWDELRGRLKGEGGAPMLYVFDTCKDWWRTMPALQHDKHQAEDLDSSMEDHAGDESRYACMSRPWTPTADTAKRARADDYGDDDLDDEEGNWKTR
ncbi:terminase [Lysobacter sp. Root667]|nr:terminase [Lysobacter sp. Root667]